MKFLDFYLHLHKKVIYNICILQYTEKLINTKHWLIMDAISYSPTSETQRIKIYEDNISGKLTDERFRNLSFNYDKEQQELKIKIEQLSKEINNTEKKTTDLSQFISNVKKYTEITELTPEILNELIEKILIHQAEKVNGKKVQEIDIYYRGVGIISFPVSLEDMTMVIEKMLNGRITA